MHFEHFFPEMRLLHCLPVVFLPQQRYGELDKCLHIGATSIDYPRFTMMANGPHLCMLGECKMEAASYHFVFAGENDRNQSALRFAAVRGGTNGDFDGELQPVALWRKIAISVASLIAPLTKETCLVERIPMIQTTRPAFRKCF